MNILCVTHADFETPGIILDWALSRNFNFKIASPYKGEILSSINSYDFLIIMGGPQSLFKIELFPYLADEIKLIKAAASENKKIWGFCLGAQLIGEALGANVEKSPEKEIGVYPVTLSQGGKDDPLFVGFDQVFDALHWHSDMPGLTDGSIVLASSVGCPRQVIKYGKAIYGFQCHLEITLDGVRNLVNAVPEDLSPSRFTQIKEELLKNNYQAINDNMLELLDRFVTL